MRFLRGDFMINKETEFLKELAKLTSSTSDFFATMYSCVGDQENANKAIKLKRFANSGKELIEAFE